MELDEGERHLGPRRLPVPGSGPPVHPDPQPLNNRHQHRSLHAFVNDHLSTER